MNGWRDARVGVAGVALLIGGLAGAPAGAAVGPSVTDDSTVIPAGDPYGQAAVASDFDGDGYQDLAVGVPGEDLRTISDAGAVNVIYGSARGLTAAGDQFWSQRSPGVPGKAERMDRFGSRVATGDFDGDGFADLIVEARGEDADKGEDVWGAFWVLYGSAAGLTSERSRLWKPNDFPDRVDDSVGIGGLVYIAGDFNGDDAEDLAIGYDVQATSHPTGWLIWGGDSGLSATVNTIAGTPMAAGDFTGDGLADLVTTTCSNCTTPWFLSLGSVSDPLGVRLTAPYEGRYLETSDHTAADVDGDGEAELIQIATEGDGPPYSLLVQNATATTIAAPGEVTSGALGLPGGLIWHGLAAGDVNDDGAADLTIAVANAPNGAVALVLGSDGSGIESQAATLWSQASPGIKGRDKPGDAFGSTVLIGAFSASGYRDAAIGVPGKRNSRGRVAVLRGTNTGLTAWGDRAWSQDSAGIKGVSERLDQFGTSVG